MSIKIEAKIHNIGQTQKVSDRFTKREFVVEYVENPLYPQYIKFDVIQDRVTLLDAVKVGEKVEISFNLKGREWTNPEGVKIYFNTLEAWRIQKVEGGAETPAANAADPFYQVTEAGPEGSDDLPF